MLEPVCLRLEWFFDRREDKFVLGDAARNDWQSRVDGDVESGLDGWSVLAWEHRASVDRFSLGNCTTLDGACLGCVEDPGSLHMNGYFLSSVWEGLNHCNPVVSVVVSKSI